MTFTPSHQSSSAVPKQRRNDTDEMCESVTHTGLLLPNRRKEDLPRFFS